MRVVMCFHLHDAHDPDPRQNTILCDAVGKFVMHLNIHGISQNPRQLQHLQKRKAMTNDS